MGGVTRGLLAGAAGTVALNLSTYGDMLLRGRPASGLPAEAADRIADRAGLSLGDEEEKDSREEAAGALMGYVTGLGIGALYGLMSGRRGPAPAWLAGPVLGLAAMAASDVPASVLGVTDPTRWSGGMWLSDLLPHLAYGMTTAAVLQALRQ
ncbi:hypothetical protein [Streptomyces sp. TRM64462]|uniref:hypothetical protein n=1 Tax=Streptomyces sp. TRM64462 TaxID=2741726 RepID=UPI001586DA01|nr:hypothetical protein [Streptomyces sp. TRM64462]